MKISPPGSIPRCRCVPLTLMARLSRPLLGLAAILALAGTAHATPILSFSTTRLDYGNQLVNIPSAAQTLTIANNGDSPLTINSISFTGTNPRDFLIGSDTGQAVLAPGAARTLGIQC